MKRLRGVGTDHETEETATYPISFCRTRATNVRINGAAASRIAADFISRSPKLSLR